MDTPDRRSSARNPVAAEAVCRTAALELMAVVTDLSADGCCLTAGWQPLVPGQHLTVRIGELDGLPAHVCWVDWLRAGVAFECPLRGPLLDNLVDQHGLVASMTVDS